MTGEVRRTMAIPHTSETARSASGGVTVFLCGDLMTGRGIDQILPHPSAPQLFEPLVRSALTYVELAERVAGKIPRPVSFDYIWGDTLGELDRLRPDVRIVNLETAVTVSDESWPSKGINYRMHPGNVPCLTAARIDCCVLANNHVLDWGHPGLAETLTALHGAGIRTAGAGNDALEAAAPAIVELPDGKRVLVFGFGTESSGVGRDWSATRKRAGVNWIGELSTRAADAIGEQVAGYKRAGDIVIASIHWGGNWGFEVSSRERVFAHRLIDGAGIDLVHGHSSHHVRGIEVYRGKAILYGCGDLLNDYEGISGHESYRGDLGLMYLPTIDSESGELRRFAMMPTRIHRLRVNRAPADGAAWLASTLDRECRKLGAAVTVQHDGTLALEWRGALAEAS
jgi:poly-gamma-glutamate synthesis protein (capsule biosynthesis protein)